MQMFNSRTIPIYSHVAFNFWVSVFVWSIPWICVNAHVVDPKLLEIHLEALAVFHGFFQWVWGREKPIIKRDRVSGICRSAMCGLDQQNTDSGGFRALCMGNSSAGSSFGGAFRRGLWDLQSISPLCGNGTRYSLAGLAAWLHVPYAEVERQQSSIWHQFKYATTLFHLQLFLCILLISDFPGTTLKMPTLGNNQGFLDRQPHIQLLLTDRCVIPHKPRLSVIQRIFR